MNIELKKETLMDSLAIFKTALQYEEKIRDLYRSADGKLDDDRGIAIFRALAEDEQSHIDFLLYSLEQLKAKGTIDITRLATSIPAKEQIEASIGNGSFSIGIQEKICMSSSHVLRHLGFGIGHPLSSCVRRTPVLSRRNN